MSVGNLAYRPVTTSQVKDPNLRAAFESLDRQLERAFGVLGSAVHIDGDGRLVLQGSVLLPDVGDTPDSVSTFGQPGQLVRSGTRIFSKDGITARDKNWNELPTTGFVQSTRRVDAGTGLLGGGDLSADRTISLNLGYSPTWTGNHLFEQDTIIGDIDTGGVLADARKLTLLGLDRGGGARRGGAIEWGFDNSSAEAYTYMAGGLPATRVLVMDQNPQSTANPLAATVAIRLNVIDGELDAALGNFNVNPAGDITAADISAADISAADITASGFARADGGLSVGASLGTAGYSEFDVSSSTHQRGIKLKHRFTGSSLTGQLEGLKIEAIGSPDASYAGMGDLLGVRCVSQFDGKDSSELTNMFGGDFRSQIIDGVNNGDSRVLSGFAVGGLFAVDYTATPSTAFNSTRDGALSCGLFSADLSGTGASFDSLTMAQIDGHGAFGSGTTVTDHYGIDVRDMQARGSTNNAAILIRAQSINPSANAGNLALDGGDYNTGHLRVGQVRLWEDQTNNCVRILRGTPAATNDGVGIDTINTNTNVIPLSSTHQVEFYFPSSNTKIYVPGFSAAW